MRCRRKNCRLKIAITREVPRAATMAECIHSSDTLTLKYLLESQSLLNPVPVSQETNESKKCDSNQDVWVGPNGVSADMAAAFLGPTLWDRKLPYDDLKLEYMDLNEFLQENGIPEILFGSDVGSNNNIEKEELSQHTLTPVSFNQSDSASSAFDSTDDNAETNDNPTPSTSDESGSVKVNFPTLPTDIALASVPGQKSFDPSTANFKDEELKPQPMIKKSKKVHVPDELKDEKYWEKRRKNNHAAKRSRDARRIKENQIAIRAGYLQKESDTYKTEIKQLKEENMNLKKIIKKYETELKLLKSNP